DWSADVCSSDLHTSTRTHTHSHTHTYTQTHSAVNYVHPECMTTLNHLFNLSCPRRACAKVCGVTAKMRTTFSPALQWSASVCVCVSVCMCVRMDSCEY